MKHSKSILLSLLLCAVFIRALAPVQPDDFFAYLALGRRLLTLGEFGATDPYLFTIPDFQWHLWHEWLSYIYFYSLLQVAGYDGIIVMRALMIVLAVGLVWKAGSRFKLSAPVLLLVVAASFYVASQRCFGDRASLFSDLFLSALLFYFTNSSSHLKTSKLKWLLPILFLLWVQLHPGFLVGWFMFGLFIVCGWHKWDSRQRRDWALIFGLSLLAPIVNPIGINGVLYPIKAIFSSEFSIFREINSEWGRTLTHGFLSVPYTLFLPVFMIATLIATGLSWRHKNRFPFLAAIVLVWLGLSAIRFLATAGFGLGILLASALGRRVGEWNRAEQPAVVLFSCALPLAFIVYTLTSHTYGIHLMVNGPLIHPAMPLKAARLFHQLPPGNIFNDFDYGGMLLWELDGKMKIAAHGHIDKPSLIVSHFIRFQKSKDDWDEIIVRGNVQYVFMHRWSITQNRETFWVKELITNWNLLYEDSQSVIFQRRR